ncbi:MAG: DUF1579 domain-containing protein [Sphingomonas sp.]
MADLQTDLFSRPSPAASSFGAPRSDGFDFLTGNWSVRHRKLRERLMGCDDWFEFDGTLSVTHILGGLGNFDRNLLDDPNGAYEAHSLRIFDSASGDWSIWWLDGRAPGVETPVVGAFDGVKGTFYGDEMLGDRSIRVRTTYEPFSDDLAEWTQAFSSDGGVIWETNWIMTFSKDDK